MCWQVQMRRQRGRYTQVSRHNQTGMQTRLVDRQIDRWRDKSEDRWIDMVDWQVDMKTDRNLDMQTDRYTGRQTSCNSLTYTQLSVGRPMDDEIPGCTRSGSPHIPQPDPQSSQPAWPTPDWPTVHNCSVKRTYQIFHTDIVLLSAHRQPRKMRTSKIQTYPCIHAHMAWPSLLDMSIVIIYQTIQS